VFAVMGLYLYLEKNFTGRQVQLAHMRMARQRKNWPQLPLPSRQSDIGVSDVISAEPGSLRDAMIRKWCAAVWEVWQESRPQIAELAKAELGVE
jgi:hypothetical protein